MMNYAKRAEISRLLQAVHHMTPFEAVCLVAHEADDSLDTWLEHLQFEYAAMHGTMYVGGNA
jgi:hypothetical protein